MLFDREYRPAQGTNYMLDPSKSNQLGRGVDCDIVLADPLCSRVHAEITFGKANDGTWWIKDADSRNGTFLREKRLEQPTRLRRRTFAIGLY